MEETVDHRSFADRGIEEQPTIHEGVTARALEKKGIISERCEINRQIKSDNSLLRLLKETIKKLMWAVRNTIPNIANAMESARQKAVIACYQLGIIRSGQKDYKNYLSAVKSDVERYDGLTNKINDVTNEREILIAEKENTVFLNIPKRKKLEVMILELSDKIDKLQAEKADMLKYLDCDDNGISKVKKDIADTEAGLKKLNAQEKQYSDKLNAALSEYARLREQAAGINAVELYEARKAIRPKKEQRAEQCLREAYGEKYSADSMLKCRQVIAKLLNEENEKRCVREKITQEQRQVDNQQVSGQLPRKKRSHLH